jgi:hypothetical protein
LTFGLGIIILQGVSRRKSLAGVNMMIQKYKIHNLLRIANRLKHWKKILVLHPDIEKE